VVLIALVASLGKGNNDDPRPPYSSSGNSPAGNDSASMNALTGNWGAYNPDFKDMPYWVFAADERFAYYDTDKVRDVPTGYYQYYERWIQGKYRVKGSGIELYDCKVSSYYSNSNKNYLGGSPYDLPANALLDTALPEPEKTRDFSVEFEFISAERLRIISNVVDGKDKYDKEFVYYGPGHNVEVPTQNMPGLAWPKDALPPDLPEYTDGRCRSVDTEEGRIYNDKADRIVDTKFTTITIDGTSSTALAAYADHLLRDGWAFKRLYTNEDLQNVIYNGIGACYLEKGYHTIVIYPLESGCFKLYAEKAEA
jgi:hypothetical protein